MSSRPLPSLTPILHPHLEGACLIQPDGYLRLFFHTAACRFDRVQVEVPLHLNSPTSLQSIRQLTLVSGAALSFAPSVTGDIPTTFTQLSYDVFGRPDQQLLLVLKAQVDLTIEPTAAAIEFRFGNYLEFHQDILTGRTVPEPPTLQVHRLMELKCCIL